MRPSPTGRYRKRPVVREAFKLTDGNISAPTLWPRWFREQTHPPEVVPFDRSLGDGPEVVINTVNGPVYGKVGDWVVLDEQGVAYPCAANVFEATYEPEGTRDEAPAEDDPFVDVMFSVHPGWEDEYRFVDVHTPTGRSVRCGEWKTIGKLRALRIRRSDIK